MTKSAPPHLLFSAPDIWEWDGRSWTRRENEAPHINFEAPGITYDANRGVTVLGRNSEEPWEWDGASWTQHSTLDTNPDFPGEMEFALDYSLFYDRARRATVYNDWDKKWKKRTAKTISSASQYRGSGMDKAGRSMNSKRKAGSVIKTK